MNYLDAAIYGIIQGFAEFLPVSSSGHLALLPLVRGIDDPGVAFDLAMHVGTAMAVFVYFFKLIKQLFIETLVLFKLKKNDRGVDTSFVENFLIATVVTVVVVFLIKSYAESFGRSSTLIAFNLFFFGILMFIADRLPTTSNMAKRSVLVASLIGLFQAIAIFPGVSRSGATLTIARFLKIPRDEAARFSFLLSLPVIIGGFILKLPELMNSETFHVGPCLFGVFISFIVGIITIHLFLKTVAKMGLAVFSLYRVVLAVVILYLSGNIL